MRRRTGEEGVALLVVMVLMGIMLSAGLAIASTVDTQSSASRAERTRDSAFNLAESALNAQVLALARDWPGAGTAATPYTACSASTPPPALRCPQSAALSAGGSPDLAGGVWQTSVHDNGPVADPTAFYADAITSQQLGYDVNRDKRVWVRAQATVEGRTRTLVALVGSEKQKETVPSAALLAGRFEVADSSPTKQYIDANGARVALRCAGPADGICLGHDLSPPFDTEQKLRAALANWVSGTSPTTGYTGATMTEDARLRLKATAVADGTFFTSCPSEAQLTGAVVYVEAGACSYAGNTTFNSAASPGMLILERGSVSFRGVSKFFGVIYAANTTNAVFTAIDTGGNGQIIGGVLVDGPAGVRLGSSSAPHIQYDPNAFQAVQSYGSAGVIQNTWREIRAG